METTQPRYDLPRPAWRTLHSAFLDFLMHSPTEIAEAMTIRIGGSLSFKRFMLAIHEGRSLGISTTVTDESLVEISVYVPVSDGPDWKLFTLNQMNHGVTADWLIDAGNFRIDEQLHSILGDAS